MNQTQKPSERLWFKFLWGFLEVINTISFDLEIWCDKWFKKLDAIDEQAEKESK